MFEHDDNTPYILGTIYELKPEQGVMIADGVLLDFAFLDEMARLYAETYSIEPRVQCAECEQYFAWPLFEDDSYCEACWNKLNPEDEE